MTPATKRGRIVVTYSCRASRHHESVTLRELASRLAAIKGCGFVGEYDPALRYSDPLYFVPNDTLVGIDAARRLGIKGEADLFGGVVPFAFTATKTITHPLPDAESHSPEGWSPEFADRVRDLVVSGYSAFARRDARVAGMRLLELGRVRLKLPTGIGGLGQSIVEDERALDGELGSLDDAALSREGLVLEQDLADVVTHSVGQTRLTLVHDSDLFFTKAGRSRLPHDLIGGASASRRPPLRLQRHVHHSRYAVTSDERP